MLRKVNDVKVGKKAAEKVLAMIDEPRTSVAPLMLEFATPIFGAEPTADVIAGDAAVAAAPDLKGLGIGAITNDEL